MLIKTLQVGHLETNCYIVTNEKTLDCVIIDPGADSNDILDYLESNRLSCRAILLTHGHYDHTGACETVAEETGAKVYMNILDDGKKMNSPYFPYSLPENSAAVSDGDILEEAGMKFEILSTPGHTPGGITIKTDGALFTGDTLFRGSCGRTDLDGGSIDDLMKSLAKICSIEGEYEVYPGHMDPSSLIREKTFNYYCRRAMNQ